MSSPLNSDEVTEAMHFAKYFKFIQDCIMMYIVVVDPPVTVFEAIWMSVTADVFKL